MNFFSSIFDSLTCVFLGVDAEESAKEALGGDEPFALLPKALEVMHNFRYDLKHLEVVSHSLYDLKNLDVNVISHSRYDLLSTCLLTRSVAREDSEQQYLCLPLMTRCDHC